MVYYHLPGLFEFYDFYRVFLPLFFEHREYFYDWCEIGSIYGAPEQCIWGGGRIGEGNPDPNDVRTLLESYGISARLTFSNSVIDDSHLSDERCNELCKVFHKEGLEHGVIIHSDLLLQYLQENYPNFYYVSSTTKVLTEVQELLEELERQEFRYVVPDFRLNKRFEIWEQLEQWQKDKLEFLCNECCWFGCQDRRKCYETVSRQNLGEDCPDHICKAPEGSMGYRFSRAMSNPGFISKEDIRSRYHSLGFQHFKIEGRGLGSALLLEFILYYLTKPEYQIHVREALYLDAMLDLF